jgi:hypothetical protein
MTDIGTPENLGKENAPKPQSPLPSNNMVQIFIEDNRLKRLIIIRNPLFNCSNLILPTSLLTFPNASMPNDGYLLTTMTNQDVQNRLIRADPTKPLIDCDGLSINAMLNNSMASQTVFDVSNDKNDPKRKRNTVETNAPNATPPTNISSPTLCFNLINPDNSITTFLAACGPIATPLQLATANLDQNLPANNKRILFQEENQLKFFQTGPNCLTLDDEWATSFTSNQLATIIYTSPNQCTDSGATLYTNSPFNLSFQSRSPGPAIDCQGNAFALNLGDNNSCTQPTFHSTATGTECIKGQDSSYFSAACTIPASASSSPPVLTLPAILGISIGGFVLLLLLLWRCHRIKA